jgi:hypothetical protein
VNDWIEIGQELSGQLLQIFLFEDNPGFEKSVATMARNAIRMTIYKRQSSLEQSHMV